MHFYVIANKYKDTDLEVTQEIVSILEEEKQQVTVEIFGSNRKIQADTLEAENIPEDVDFIIALGGDGTLLQVAVATMEKEIPLLGVNLGNLGFLAEIERPQIRETLLSVIQGDYEIEKRMMIHGSVYRGGKCLSEKDALNDICLVRGDVFQIMSYNIYVNNKFLYRYHADGMIVATPTGSTAYNLSAGGPIVEPSADIMVLTPICPHTLNSRSIILSPEDVIELEIACDKEGAEQEAVVSFDGGISLGLKKGDRIRIQKSKKKINIVKLDQISFVETVSRKMGME